MKTESNTQSEEIYTFLETLEFVKGAGDPAQGTACAMSAAVALDRITRGEPLGESTDKLECVCPVLRALVIKKSDSFTDNALRKEWAITIVPRLLNTRQSEEVTLQRVFRVVDFAVRIAAPKALREAGLEKEAKTLEKLPEINSKEAAIAARAEATTTAANAATNAATEASEVAYVAAYVAAKATYAASATAAKAASAAAKAAYAATEAAAYAATHAANAAATYAATHAANAAAGLDAYSFIEEFLN